MVWLAERAVVSCWGLLSYWAGVLTKLLSSMMGYASETTPVQPHPYACRPIPPSYTALTSLQRLSAAGNNLSGAVPAAWLSARARLTLDLFNNTGVLCQSAAGALGSPATAGARLPADPAGVHPSPQKPMAIRMGCPWDDTGGSEVGSRHG